LADWDAVLDLVFDGLASGLGEALCFGFGDFDGLAVAPACAQLTPDGNEAGVAVAVGPAPGLELVAPDDFADPAAPALGLTGGLLAAPDDARGLVVLGGVEVTAELLVCGEVPGDVAGAVVGGQAGLTVECRPVVAAGFVPELLVGAAAATPDWPDVP
jgi:hypothetical protein